MTREEYIALAREAADRARKAADEAQEYARRAWDWSDRRGAFAEDEAEEAEYSAQGAIAYCAFVEKAVNASQYTIDTSVSNALADRAESLAASAKRAAMDADWGK